MDHFSRNRLVRATVTLPASLLEELDRRTGRRGRSRYIADATAQRMHRDALGTAIRETAGAVAGTSGAMSPEEVVRWIDELRSGTPE